MGGGWPARPAVAVCCELQFFRPGARELVCQLGNCDLWARLLSNRSFSADASGLCRAKPSLRVPSGTGLPPGVASAARLYETAVRKKVVFRGLGVWGLGDGSNKAEQVRNRRTMVSGRAGR